MCFFFFLNKYDFKLLLKPEACNIFPTIKKKTQSVTVRGNPVIEQMLFTSAEEEHNVEETAKFSPAHSSTQACVSVLMSLHIASDVKKLDFHTVRGKTRCVFW